MKKQLKNKFLSNLKEIKLVTQSFIDKTKELDEALDNFDEDELYELYLNDTEIKQLIDEIYELDKIIRG